MYTFKKLDEDRRLIGGVAYRVSNEPDSQGDYIDDADTLFEGMLSFAKSGMSVGYQHEGDADAFVVEQFMTESQPIEKHGCVIPPYSWWLTIRVESDQLWKQVKDGTLRGLSIAGKAEAHG